MGGVVILGRLREGPFAHFKEMELSTACWALASFGARTRLHLRPAPNS